ncbi:TetR/AcrR family transcriptional regulator [Uniformispora flossi]|uniref:TetR/AcrR family transcriptional regulator n=1 Tax=Uniformispora flossi TaxID=3390723 RepID=UPI003C2E787B
MSSRQSLILETAAGLIARRGVRGLRVEELATEAGVSVGLVYYHFGDRAGLMQHTWEFINERAERYTSSAGDPDRDPRGRLEDMLLLELQDVPEVRENSTAWGEFRASAVFEPDLGRQVREATARWVRDAESLIRHGQDTGAIVATVAATDAAERLTALVEGLSERWLAGSLPLERARFLLRGALTLELGPQPPHPARREAARPHPARAHSRTRDLAE